MNANVNRTNNSKRLIAAVIAMAMIMCAVAAVSTPSNAGYQSIVANPAGAATVTDWDSVESSLAENSIVIFQPTEWSTVEDVVLSSDFTIPAGKTLIIGSSYNANGYDDTKDPVVNTANFTITVNQGVNFIVNGTLYNNLGITAGTSPFVINGDLVLGNGGIVNSTCAFRFGEDSSITGFFTNSNGTNGTQYKHMYAGDINDLIPYVNSVNYSDLENQTDTARAIYSYGSVSITGFENNNATTINNITLKVGGVSGSPAVLTVASGVTAAFNSVEVKTGSQANIYGTLTGNTVTNNGTVRILSENATFDAVGTDETIGGSGTIDTSAVSENATLSGRLLTSTEFTERQIVTVTDDLTLVSGTVLTIRGQLIIPEGVTVTIQDGAKLLIDGQSVTVDNNGTIIVQSTGTGTAGTDNGGLQITGGTFTNDGTVEAQYLPEVSATGADATVISIAGTFVNNGTVTIGTDSGIEVKGANSKFTNVAGSQFDMNGTIATDADKFTNAGTVTFNGFASGNVNIDLTGADATVVVNALTGTLEITDNGYKTGTRNEFANVDDSNNLVRLWGGNEFTVSGITVSTTTFTDDRLDANGTAGTDGVDETYKALDISGTVTVATTGTTVDSTSSAVRLVGEIVVSDTFNVGAGTALRLGPSTGDEVTNLQVTGTMNITANSNVTVSAGQNKAFLLGTTGTVNVYVSGEIASQTNLKATGTGIGYTIVLNAAAYSEVASGITTYYYTTLEAAIASGATSINTYGNITVTADVTVANGVTVRQDSNSTITISEDATVTVADGGRIIQNGSTIDVNGTLYITVARTGISGVTTSPEYSILSQVYSSDGTDARYTNLVNAMDAAESGDTITLYSKEVTLQNTSFTIKEGVTVDTDGKGFSVEGTSLIINGTLFINGPVDDFSVGTYTAPDSTYSAPSTVTLNGYLKFTDSVAYSSTDLRFPAGAYYSMTENGVPYYYITTAANAAQVINDTVDNTILINGRLSLGTISFTGTADEQAIIDIASTAEITSGTITLSLAELNITAGAEFNATVTDGTGSVAVEIVDPETGTATAAPSFEVTADDGLTVSGNATGAEMTFNGEVIINNMTNISVMTVEGTVTVDGNNTSVATDGTVTVSGVLHVLNGTFTASDANTYVTGTLSTAVASADSNDFGNASLGSLYVGISVETQNGKRVLVDGEPGTVTGNVANITYVSADSTVPETMTTGDDMKSTVFYVDDTLWMTAYTADSTVHADVPNAPIKNAEFIGWNDADGNLVYCDTDTGTPVIPNTNAIEVGAYDGALYANINYDVYYVVVNTDGGINSVAVDGVILYQSSNNSFSNRPITGYYDGFGLTAGTHTLSFTMKNGYEGTIVMTIDGTQQSGYSFELSGDYGVSNALVINLTGSTPTSGSVVIDNGGSDMGLTDYLLIILVVLIVIMAIMVAMRLMRS